MSFTIKNMGGDFVVTNDSTDSKRKPVRNEKKNPALQKLTREATQLTVATKTRSADREHGSAS